MRFQKTLTLFMLAMGLVFALPGRSRSLSRGSMCKAWRGQVPSPNQAVRLRCDPRRRDTWHKS